MAGAWQETLSPFHKGEQLAQERVGVRDKVEKLGRQVIRDHLPDQHREFYGELPFVILGTVDDEGRPWASLVPGRPGFMTTPDARTLDVGIQPLFGDLLNDTLRPGTDIGVLGIQPDARRRNRLTGRIDSVRSGGFTVSVHHTFGNCPQYIQTRTVEVLTEIDTPERERKLVRSDRFDETARRLIEQADTLFIATAHVDGDEPASQGADVSHRGGRPGFVRIENDRTLVFPDFSGNFHFNTVGNILVNPQAGFLFADFESGDLVYLSGTAEIVWNGQDVAAFAGAERLIRFQADMVIRVEASLPLRFTFGEYSPMLEHTGSWQQAIESIAADRERNVYVEHEVVRIERESEAITSFYLRRADGKGLASYRPGQFLPIRVPVPGQPGLAARTYTISDGPTAGHYRLSIKREGGDAVVSNFFHDRVAVGSRLEALAPRGKFVFDEASERPVVLISAGVGITPMIAMANFIAGEGQRTRTYRRTYFIHGARNGKAHAFADDIRQWADGHELLTAHIRYSRPADDDQLGKSYDSEGHIDLALLKSLLPFDDYDFYLCGPQPFMQALYDGLTGMGVSDAQIHYESFGPATVLKHDAANQRPSLIRTGAQEPVAVSFAGSNIDLEWSPDKGTLLDLAEAAGLNPEYSCRSGICGTCATQLKCGDVDYIEEPSAPLADGEVLICCSTPKPGAGAAACGENVGVVLEL